MELRGLYPATVTPFSSDLTIDTAALGAHLKATAAEDGVQGLVVNGHVGEVLSLSPEERDAVVRLACGNRRSGQLVIAGLEARSVSEAVELGLRAKEAGADALLVLPPFDIRPYRKLIAHRSSVVSFFRELDRRVSLPMIVFQYPKRSLCNYPIEVLAALSDLESVVGIKVAAEDVNGYVDVWEALGGKLSILAASDSPPLLGMLLYGSHGALIGISVVGSRHWAEMVSSALSGKAERAREIYKKMAVPLMCSIFENQQPGGVISEAAATKEALVHLGQIPSSRVRPPSLDVDEARSKLIRQSLLSAGLIDGS